MTAILQNVRYSGHGVAPKLQETRLKGHRLQDDTDSKEFDQLLAELQSLPEDHNVKGFYQNGLSFACNDCTVGVQKCEDGAEAGKYSHTHSDLDINVKMLNDSQLGKKDLESKVKNMPVVGNVDKNKHVQGSRPVMHDSRQPKHNMPSVKKIENQIVDSKHSKCNSVQENKLQAYIANSAKSKPHTPGLSSSLVNDAHSSKHAVMSGNTAPAATLSLAELAQLHRSQRSKVASVREVIPVSKAPAEDVAKLSCTTFQHRDQTAQRVVGSFSNCSDSFVGSFESPNGKLGQENAKSTPAVLGCSSSAGSLTEPPAASSQRAGPSSGMSLSQLALQHRQSKSPLSTVSPRNGYINGRKPSLLHLMKNVAIDDMRTSTAGKASCGKVPSREPVASLSLTLCLKLNRASDISTKLPCGQQKSDTEDFDVSNTFTLMDSQSGQPDAEPQEQDIPTDLIPQVSSVGLVLCCLKRKRKLSDSSSNLGNTLKYPKFECGIQVGNRKMYPEIVLRKIKPFDFSTPSPDDIVKHKQKQAFTRPLKEFEF